jgi:C4-dicarboxylate transporter
MSTPLSLVTDPRAPWGVGVAFSLTAIVAQALIQQPLGSHHEFAGAILVAAPSFVAGLAWARAGARGRFVRLVLGLGVLGAFVATLPVASSLIRGVVGVVAGSGEFAQSSWRDVVTDLSWPMGFVLTTWLLCVLAVSGLRQIRASRVMNPPPA